MSNLVIESRSEVAALITDTKSDPGTLFAAGMLLVMAACAKDGTTLTESLDNFRDVWENVHELEDKLRIVWDPLRSW